MLYSAFLLKVVVDLNNQMLSVVIHAGYEGGDISEKEYITHVNDFVLFSASIATFITCMNHQR